MISRLLLFRNVRCFYRNSSYQPKRKGVHLADKKQTTINLDAKISSGLPGHRKTVVPIITAVLMIFFSITDCVCSTNRTWRYRGSPLLRRSHRNHTRRTITCRRIPQLRSLRANQRMETRQLPLSNDSHHSSVSHWRIHPRSDEPQLVASGESPPYPWDEHPGGHLAHRPSESVPRRKTNHLEDLIETPRGFKHPTHPPGHHPGSVRLRFYVRINAYS